MKELGYKNGKFYIIYGIVVLLYFFGSDMILEKVKQYSDKTYNMHLYYITYFIVSYMFGALISIESFYREMCKAGRWKLNKIKVIFICGPCFILGLFYWGPMLMMPLIPMEGILIPQALFVLIDKVGGLLIIFLGWGITTSFYKEEQELRIKY